MRVRHISLTNFRLYARLEASLPAGPLLLVGANAQGKTSLLEAVFFLATGQSHHAAADRQLIHFLALSEPQPFARLVAEVETQRETLRIEIRLVLEPGAGADGRLRKDVLINGVKKRVGDLAGRVQAVLFLPQDLGIVEGAPADRRRYLDLALGQVDPAYHAALSEYAKVLPQRNALLKQLQERGGSPDQLEFWDDKLCELAGTLMAARLAALAELEALAGPLHRDLTAGAEGLRLAYHPAFDLAAAPDGQLGLPLQVPVHQVGVSAAEIEGRLRAKLRASRAEEIARGLTLSGPHRDELRFIANGLDVGLYGSRGQARTAVLALKLAETAWMRARAGEWPILLLDEVLAELDINRRRDLLRRLDRADQCLMTTTDRDLFPEEFQTRAAIWTVQNGRLVTEKTAGGA
ncbi:MAG: DNA replication/repair protein RecF [Anaerolineales bacterium]|nr:DNA replication/repair protein RecF [Anaerolineales bacterium]